MTTRTRIIQKSDTKLFCVKFATTDPSATRILIGAFGATIVNGPAGIFEIDMLGTHTIGLIVALGKVAVIGITV